MSKIAVIGAGYVGLTTAACFADLGNEVVVVDIDREKINQLKQHKVPFYEPGLSELVKRNAASGRLRFTTSYGDAIPGAEYALIAVSTPEGEGGEADLSAVEAAANSIADAMDGPLVVINKSTVPPLTGDMVSTVMNKRNSRHQAQVVSNPEFLREGSAIQDFMKPDRVVIGGHDREAAEKVARLYDPLDAPVLITPNIYTAEMVKYASNAFLATRISFINEISRICERVDADAKLVAEGMGLDKRIGSSYLDVGIGYGGSCLVGEETVLVRQKNRVSVETLAEVYSLMAEKNEIEVLAWWRDNATTQFLPVRASTIRPIAGQILKIHTEPGNTVLCTPDHPWVTRNGIRLAASLTTLDYLPLVMAAVPVMTRAVREPVAAGAMSKPDDLAANLSAATFEMSRATSWVRIVGIESYPFEGSVYSLEVPGAHTFVTTGGLVTHNCFPKDVAALAALAGRFDYHPELLHAVMDINRDQRMLVIDKLKECLDGSLDGRTVGLLGLAFKPNTDDLREAPSLDIARVLLAAGAAVRAYDPAAMDGARARLPEIDYRRDAYDLAGGADAVVIVTEWNEFRRLDLPRLKKAMGRPVIIDGRNIYDPEVMRGLGFTYRGIGRE